MPFYISNNICYTTVIRKVAVSCIIASIMFWNYIKAGIMVLASPHIVFISSENTVITLRFKCCVLYCWFARFTTLPKLIFVIYRMRFKLKLWCNLCSTLFCPYRNRILYKNLKRVSRSPNELRSIIDHMWVHYRLEMVVEVLWNFRKNFRAFWRKLPVPHLGEELLL